MLRGFEIAHVEDSATRRAELLIERLVEPGRCIVCCESVFLRCCASLDNADGQHTACKGAAEVFRSTYSSAERCCHPLSLIGEVNSLGVTDTSENRLRTIVLFRPATRCHLDPFFDQSHTVHELLRCALSLVSEMVVIGLMSASSGTESTVVGHVRINQREEVWSTCRAHARASSKRSSEEGMHSSSAVTSSNPS